MVSSFDLLLSTKNVFSCLIENLSKTKVLNEFHNWKRMKEEFQKRYNIWQFTHFEKKSGKVASIFHFLYLRFWRPDTLKFLLPKNKLLRQLTFSSSAALPGRCWINNRFCFEDWIKIESSNFEIVLKCDTNLDYK